MKKSAVSKLPSQPNQSVISAMECLEAVVASVNPVGGRELARMLDLDRVRANRLLMTLAHCGVLERTETGQYRPGPGVHVLAALSAEGSSLQRFAVPHIRTWWNEGYAVTLGVLWRGYISYLVRAIPGKPLEESLGGRRGPAWESSAGLVLLSTLTPRQLAKLNLDEPTVVKESLPLAKLVARTRRDGYATLHFPNDSISIGCTIGDPVIAGLAVSKPGIVEKDVPALLLRLRETAAAIQRSMQSRV